MRPPRLANSGDGGAGLLCAHGRSRVRRIHPGERRVLYIHNPAGVDDRRVRFLDQHQPISRRRWHVLFHARGQDRESDTGERPRASLASGPSQATGAASEATAESSTAPAESTASASGAAAPTSHPAPAAAVPSRATGRTAGAPKSSYDRADCVGAPLPSDLCKLTPASNPSTHTASCLSVCCSCAQVAWAIEDGSQEPGATQSSSCAAFFANLCSFGKITHVPNPSPPSANHGCNDGLPGRTRLSNDDIDTAVTYQYTHHSCTIDSS